MRDLEEDLAAITKTVSELEIKVDDANKELYNCIKLMIEIYNQGEVYLNQEQQTKFDMFKDLLEYNKTRR